MLSSCLIEFKLLQAKELQKWLVMQKWLNHHSDIHFTKLQERSEKLNVPDPYPNLHLGNMQIYSNYYFCNLCKWLLLYYISYAISFTSFTNILNVFKQTIEKYFIGGISNIYLWTLFFNGNWSSEL